MVDLEKTNQVPWFEICVCERGGDCYSKLYKRSEQVLQGEAIISTPAGIPAQTHDGSWAGHQGFPLAIA